MIIHQESSPHLETYLPSLFHKEEWKSIPQLRTIPVKQSIDNELKVLPYKKAREWIKEKSSFVVTPCICREETLACLTWP